MNPGRIHIREAFDRHATTYDERFSSLAQAIRQDVWRIADSVFPPGTHLLDIGSGTGDDAIHFAQRGVRVTAVDIAPQMMARLLLKADSAGLRAQIDARCADIETSDFDGCRFDGVFSNFGAINCFDQLAWLGRLARQNLKPGAFLLLVTMGRVYPLETAVFLLRGKFERAFRRLQRTPEVRIEGLPVPVRYYSPKQFARVLGSELSLVQLAGLRSLVPVPSLEHLERRLPMGILRRLDSIVTRLPLTAAFSDHYISLWRRR